MLWYHHRLSGDSLPQEECNEARKQARPPTKYTFGSWAEARPPLKRDLPEAPGVACN